MAAVCIDMHRQDYSLLCNVILFTVCEIYMQGVLQNVLHIILNNKFMVIVNLTFNRSWYYKAKWKIVVGDDQKDCPTLLYFSEVQY